MKKIFFLLLLLPVLAYSQLVNVSSMNAPGVAIPSITTSVSIISTPFSTNVGSFSTSQTFTTSASSLTGGGLVTAPTGYEVSMDNSSYGPTRTISISGGVFTSQPVTIWVRLTNAAAVGPYNGNVSISSTGAATRTVAVSGTVNSTSPSLSVSGTFSPLNTTAGNATTPQTITLSGTNLTANAVITPPSPIKVSLDNITYATSASITPSSGSLPGQPVTIWAQIPSTATAQSSSGNVAFTSTGAATVNLSATWTVSAGGTTNDTIDVAIPDSLRGINVISSSAPSFINSWGVNPNTVIISKFFKYRTGVQTTVRAQFDALNDIVDNGSGYNSGTTSGYLPDIFRTGAFNNASPASLTLTGLVPATNGYRLEILCSHVNTGTVTRNVTFAVGATSQTVNAIGNDVTVVLDNLTPSSGTVLVNITAANTFWYVNGFRLIKKN